MSALQEWRGVLVATHLSFVMFWMAGLFYLPRLFVYHLEARALGDGVGEARFVRMARRLSWAIMTPAMVLAWVFGLTLAWSEGLLGAGWFHAKLAVVLALTAFHAVLLVAGRRLARGATIGSARRWRLWNEVGPLLAVAAIFLATLKP